MKKLVLALCLTMVPVLAQGKTFYVGKTGASDGHSCSPQAESPSTPKLTINAGVSCLSPGDTLMVGAGIYVEVLHAIPSGTAGNPVTVKANPGETVVLQPTAATLEGYESPSVIRLYYQSYIVLDGLVIDLTNFHDLPTGGTVESAIIAQEAADHITIQNMEIANNVAREGYYSQAISTSATTSFFTIRNNHIHHMRYGGDRGSAYGVYLAGGHDHLVEGNHFHHMGAYGIHGYAGNPTNNHHTIRNNVFHDLGAPGMLVGAGDNYLVYNNTIYNCSTREYYGGIVLGFGGAGSQIYNNTIYNCNGTAIVIRNYGGGPEQTDAIIRNNIGWQNAGGGGDRVDGGGSNAVIDHNLMGSDPRFVNEAAGDFHLQPTSPAINAGVNVGLPYTGPAP